MHTHQPDRLYAHTGPTPLTVADHASLIQALSRTSRYHLQVDWQTVPDLVRDPAFHCQVIKQRESIGSALGATVHTTHRVVNRAAPETAWLRLILPASSHREDPWLDLLWRTLSANLAAQGVRSVHLLLIQPWAEAYVRRWGFQPVNAVIALQRRPSPVPPPPDFSARIRDVTAADLERVAHLDASAFLPEWHHDLTAMELAIRQAATFTVLEENGQLLGYQLSTWHIEVGHLARLAVAPEFQGRGLGKLLVSHMIRFFQARDVRALTVNTQADNLASQKLYTRLGFQPTGHNVPLWRADLPK